MAGQASGDLWPGPQTQLGGDSSYLPLGSRSWGPGQMAVSPVEIRRIPGCTPHQRLPVLRWRYEESTGRHPSGTSFGDVPLLH